jgi:small subunit ribosomal protein S4
LTGAFSPVSSALLPENVAGGQFGPPSRPTFRGSFLQQVDQGLSGQQGGPSKTAAKQRSARVSKRENSKYKIDRRLRVNLWGRPKSPINKREYGPGQHGQARTKPTDYRLQLMAKQRLKGYYGSVSERQLRRYYLEAVRRKGDTGENLVELLERRLDAVIYRMKFAITPFASRQLVSHGHVKVNGKRVNIASYLVRDNDVIELTAKAKEMARIIESTQSAEREVPEYVSVDHKEMKGTFVRGPKLADVPYPVQMEPSLVVEYYSR